jgi:hypothetical protein
MAVDEEVAAACAQLRNELEDARTAAFRSRLERNAAEADLGVIVNEHSIELERLTRAVLELTRAVESLARSRH